MRLRAPGWPWLLAHELRLAWRASKAGAVLLPVLLGILWLFMHAGTWFIFRVLDPDRILHGPPLVVAGAITWAFLFLDLALAFGLAVVALFERGDFDLLLSSPIRPRTVFVVRGLGVAAQSIAFAAFLWVPVANGAIMHGHWRMLASYAVIVAFALGATSVAFAATLALVIAFGVRRAKVIAQIAGAIAGALMFLVSQAVNLVPDDRKREIAAWMESDTAQAWLGADSPLWLPARALFGDLFAALVTIAAGVGMFLAVVVLCERIFLEGTRESIDSQTRRDPAAARRARFRSGLVPVVILKELRLLWRDPKLISQTLLQILYLIPLAFIAMRRGSVLDGLAPLVILIGASLAGSLAWMTVSGEEAPDLLGSAPVRGRRVLWLKIAAALVAPLAICLPFFVAYAMQSIVAAIVFLACLAGGLASSAVLQACNARPGSGRDLKKRVQSSKLANLLEFVGSAGWAGTCFALMHGLVWIAPIGLAVGIAVPLSTWFFKRDALAADPA